MEPGPAHLRTLREAVGLSAQQAAAIADVALRTWQYWETGDAPAKIDAIAKLEDLLALTLSNIASMDEALEQIEDTPAEDAPIILTRYRNQAALDRAHPAFPGGISAHSAMIANMLVHLRSLDFEVLVLWDDSPHAHINYDG